MIRARIAKEEKGLLRATGVHSSLPLTSRIGDLAKGISSGIRTAAKPVQIITDRGDFSSEEVLFPTSGKCLTAGHGDIPDAHWQRLFAPDAGRNLTLRFPDPVGSDHYAPKGGRSGEFWGRMATASWARANIGSSSGQSSLSDVP